MDEPCQNSHRALWSSRVAIGIALLIPLFTIPWGNEPSLAGWIQAYVRGKGTPHFPLSGTPASRIADFFNRHPDLIPRWREVPAEANGHLLLRDFVKSGAAERLAIPEGLGAMLLDETKWDQDAAQKHGAIHRESLEELRRIALLPERSSRGKPAEEVMESRKYKQLADVLQLSLQQHLHAKRMEEAFVDFSAIHGFAGHIDRHEAPNFLDQTVGTLVRLAAQGALCKSLKDMPADIDWSPWIRVLENEPSYETQMEATWRGEAWSTIHNIHHWYLAGNERNPIWDFKEFEDAYAHRLRTSAKPFAMAGTWAGLGSLKKLEDAFTRREAGLSKAAREGLGAIHIGMSGWAKGSIRAYALFSRTRAALQVLQAEREGGTISSAGDSRLGSLATDPSNTMPFSFDPATRQLSAAIGSALVEEPPVQLPAR